MMRPAVLLPLSMMIAAPAAASDTQPCGAGLVCASKPQSVVEAMQAGGYKAKLDKDDAGDPMVSSGSSGYNFTVFFYGCESHTTCDSLQFRISFEHDGTETPQLANLWNADKRFSQASIDDKGQFVLSYDVTTVGGLTSANFADVLDWWSTMLGNARVFFKEHPAPTPKPVTHS